MVVGGVAAVALMNQARGGGTAAAAGGGSPASRSGAASATGSAVSGSTPGSAQASSASVARIAHEARWTSADGVVLCVYYPRNKDGVPSVNCWDRVTNVVYHLYPDDIRVEVLDPTTERGSSLMTQFQAGSALRWSIDQSAEFLSPLTGLPEYRCQLQEPRSLSCQDLSTTQHWFKVGGADAGSG